MAVLRVAKTYAPDRKSRLKSPHIYMLYVYISTIQKGTSWMLWNIIFQLGGQMERETGRERAQPAKKEGRGERGGQEEKLKGRKEGRKIARKT